MDDIVFRIKEGAQYQLQLNFFVQREIVTGLKYIHKVYKHGIPGMRGGGEKKGSHVLSITFSGQGLIYDWLLRTKEGPSEIRNSS